MNNRATYRFEGDAISPVVYCYTHYNGHPVGAADYFANMLDCEKTCGGLAARFVRANNLAEFTRNHESHSDTGYRYDIDQNGKLSAYQRVVGSGEWEVFFTGSVAVFIAQHRPLRGPYALLSYPRRLSLIRRDLAKIINCAEYALEHGWAGNASGALLGVRAYLDLLSKCELTRFKKLDAAIAAALK